MSARITDIVVFASGRGSNFRALCEAQASGRLGVRITALVTNVRESGAGEVAREFRIPVIQIEHTGMSREDHEGLVMAMLATVSFEWIVLAGYMRLFTAEFVRHYWVERLHAARILNIHPSLLPAFPGKDGYGQALRYGVKVAGATVHLVGAGLDDGPIVAQRALDVRDDDTVESLSSRGLELEHELYVESLSALVSRPWVVTSEPGLRPRVAWRSS